MIITAIDSILSHSQKSVMRVNNTWAITLNVFLSQGTVGLLYCPHQETSAGDKP